MDDNSFDKKIREKAEGYKDTGFDENALAGLHQRLAGASRTGSYGRYRAIAGYAAAVLFISLLNFGLFAWFENRHDEKLMAEMQELQQDRQAFNRLKQDFEVLKASKVDTIYIYKEVGSTRLASADAGVADEGLQWSSKAYNLASENIEAKKEGDVLLANVGELSDEVKAFLARYQLAYTDQKGNVYLQYDHRDDVRFVAGRGYDDPFAWHQPTGIISNVSLAELKENKATANKKQRLSTAMLRDIEKQKMKGIGFQYGPVAEVLALSPDRGSGRPGLAVGATAEFILSPSLRIETGAKYAYTGYVVKDPAVLDARLSKYPGLNEDLGLLQKIQQQTVQMSFPIHLKYMHPVARDRYLFASLGVSPQLYLLQHFEYEYAYQTNGREDDLTVNIEASKRVDEGIFYPGTADMSLGVEKKLKNNAILQLSAFYNQGLGAAGIEGSRMNMVGLRSALKFRVN